MTRMALVFCVAATFSLGAQAADSPQDVLVARAMVAAVAEKLQANLESCRALLPKVEALPGSRMASRTLATCRSTVLQHQQFEARFGPFLRQETDEIPR